jgi:hypothetical protein
MEVQGISPLEKVEMPLGRENNPIGSDSTMQ